MDNFIALIIIFAFGWYIGSRVQFWLDQITFKHILDDLGISNKQLTSLISTDELPAVNQNTADGTTLTPLEVVIEQHQGVLYAYRKDNKQFLGQGTDQQTLVDSIARRMTDVRLIIDSQDGADLLQKNNT
jgi:hypothetical protein